jgi:hypothetical protein
MSRRPGERWTRFAGRIANAFGLVLLLVIGSYVLGSLTPYRGWTGVLISALLCLTACVALGTAGARARNVRRAVGLSVVAVALAVVAEFAGEDAFLGASALVQVLLLTAAAFAVLRAVVFEREVGFRTILGAISVYVTLGLLFAFLYAGVDKLQPDPFFGATETGQGDFLFFSLTTLSTTGYGNLVPAEQPGKMLAGLEMLIGQIFLVTLIAGLVSLWRPGQRRSDS